MGIGVAVAVGVAVGVGVAVTVGVGDGVGVGVASGVGVGRAPVCTTPTVGGAESHPTSTSAISMRTRSASVRTGRGLRSWGGGECSTRERAWFDRLTTSGSAVISSEAEKSLGEPPPEANALVRDASASLSMTAPRAWMPAFAGMTGDSPPSPKRGRGPG